MRQSARKAVSAARGTRSTGPRPFVRRLRRRAARRRAARRRTIRDNGRLGWVRLGTAPDSPWLRRGALVAVLLGLAVVPYASQGETAIVSAAACHANCHAGAQNMLRWTQILPGAWDVLPGLSGTTPPGTLAYAATGNGIAVIGTGLTVYAYSATTGKPLWQDTLTGFPAAATIVSVRSWPDEVTAGVSYQGQRTEVVIPDSAGRLASQPGQATQATQANQYPSAPFGGAVAATAKYTVIVGATAVTSYDNATGHIRWQRSTGQVAQGWQVDGRYLYVAESASGYLGSAPVTALRRIDTVTGVQQQILPPAAAGSTAIGGTSAFAGTLAAALDGVVLFTAATGVTAYSGTTGVRLWSMTAAVPEGTDPQQGRFYLTRGSTLLAVSPLSGRIRVTAPSGGLYVVRDGMALGLDPGVNGDAWGYYLAGQRVAMTASGLGWPHYFVDVSGIGGSADPASDLVVIAACAQAGPAVTTQPTSSLTPSPSAAFISPAASASANSSASGTASSSPGASSSASPSATPSASTSAPAPVTQACLRPELVALSL